MVLRLCSRQWQANVARSYSTTVTVILSAAGSGYIEIAADGAVSRSHPGRLLLDQGFFVDDGHIVER
jgi:hypothetical protein